MNEIQPFLRELSLADFDSLMAELEPIAFGGDVAAKEAALREIETDAVSIFQSNNEPERRGTRRSGISFLFFLREPEPRRESGNPG